jgi:hypothetical protein
MYYARIISGIMNGDGEGKWQKKIYDMKFLRILRAKR